MCLEITVIKKVGFLFGVSKIKLPLTQLESLEWGPAIQLALAIMSEVDDNFFHKMTNTEFVLISSGLSFLRLLTGLFFYLQACCPML